MIIINIASNKEQVIKRATELLLKEKLMIDVNYKDNATRLNLVDGKLIESNLYIITAKTKALLFSKIETLLKEIFKEELLELYSLPITTMEQSQSEFIISNTQKV